MAVYFDNWKVDINERPWQAKRRYNDRRPFTVLQYSSGRQPLAIGGEIAARSGDLLRDAGITCRLCVAGEDTKWDGGERPPPIAGVYDLKDFVWNYWCTGSGFPEINDFVRNVAFQLRTEGVLLYCKQGANRSAAAAIAVITYITGAPWKKCEEMARGARAIVDISDVALQFPAIVDYFPERDREDAVVLTELRSRSISISRLDLRQHDYVESLPKHSRKTGIWIFYNQAEGLDWPMYSEGPFRDDWNTSSHLAQFLYGRIRSGGGAERGRASGVPFAVVSAHCSGPPASEVSFGYRFGMRSSDNVGHETYYWTPCPRAAYCWIFNLFPTIVATNEESATLLDMPDYILRCLLQLSKYIDSEFVRHERKGSFEERARLENRKPGDIRKAWVRRAGIVKQIEEALEGYGTVTEVIVTPERFFNSVPSPLQDSLRFHEYILTPLTSPVPHFRAKSLSSSNEISIVHARALIVRKMHADVWSKIKQSPTSPCQAGHVPQKLRNSIFLNDVAAWKACSQRTSKLRVVWVCARDAYSTAALVAEGGDYDRVLEQGTLSIVKSESVDGGRIRLCRELPCFGPVIVKLLDAVFVEYFVFDCLARAQRLPNPMKELLGVPSSMPPSGHVLRNATLDGCLSAERLSHDQIAAIMSILASPVSIHSLWSIAGGGKTRTMACILEVWRRQHMADDTEEMAWIMVPRQLLREDLLNAVTGSFPHGELEIAMVPHLSGR